MRHLFEKSGQAEGVGLLERALGGEYTVESWLQLFLFCLGLSSVAWFVKPAAFQQQWTAGWKGECLDLSKDQF